MTDVKKNVESRDYHERFEFRLTVGENIICQRYFKINNFNHRSLSSVELVDAVRGCARTIDNDLKSKSQVYLEIYAPLIFNTLEEMETYFANERNVERMKPGYGIVVKSEETDFIWDGSGKPVPSSFKFDDGELGAALTEKERVEYKFAFCVDGREVCSTIWEGIYPKYIRNSIDLSNRQGKRDVENVYHLNFEQYLQYKLVEGRNDLVWGLIKDICYACSSQDNNWYTTSEVYETKDAEGNVVGPSKKYNNRPDYSLWVDRRGNLINKTW